MDTYQPFDLQTSDTFSNFNTSDTVGYGSSYQSVPIYPSMGPPFPPTSNSPAPARLSGEPAFCAGRHCCKWTQDGYTCDSHFHSAADLDNHVATQHAGRTTTGLPSGDYNCHWLGCTKPVSFGNKPKLTRHIHSHTGHKPHMCSHFGCGRAFVTKEQLKNHETTHTRSKGHVCGVCGKGFAVKTALTSHMNVHKGAKPYVCEECGKGFADSSNLSKHRAIHKRAALKKAHHGRKGSECETCSPSPSLLQSPPMMLAHMPMAAVQQWQLPPVPDWEATPSTEQETAEHCVGRPCFDALCPQVDKIPCRSVSPCKSLPCSARGCSVPPCELQACDTPAVCDSPHCELPDCDWADCDFDHCELDHFDHCNLGDCAAPHCGPQCPRDGGHDGLSTPSMDSAAPPTPAQSFASEPLPVPADTQPYYQRAPHNHDPDCEFAESFKHIEDFLNGDICGCTSSSTR